MLLEEIQATVVATLQAAGMKSLEELVPAESKIGEFRTQLHQMEVRLDC